MPDDIDLTPFPKERRSKVLTAEDAEQVIFRAYDRLGNHLQKLRDQPMKTTDDFEAGYHSALGDVFIFLNGFAKNPSDIKRTLDDLDRQFLSQKEPLEGRTVRTVRSRNKPRGRAPKTKQTSF